MCRILSGLAIRIIINATAARFLIFEFLIFSQHDFHVSLFLCPNFWHSQLCCPYSCWETLEKYGLISCSIQWTECCRSNVDWNNNLIFQMEVWNWANEQETWKEEKRERKRLCVCVSCSLGSIMVYPCEIRILQILHASVYKIELSSFGW